MTFRITRFIEIDAGHRIMTHGSKCRHIHGHRYRIEIECQAPDVQPSGEQTGMVLDFGFLKEEMLTIIDQPCDHGFLASIDDTELLSMFGPADGNFTAWLAELAQTVKAQGYARPDRTRLATKLYVVPFQPTAECLARHWYGLLETPVHTRSGGIAKLTKVRVWETPNCVGEFCHSAAG